MRYITEAKLKEADVEVYNIIEEELKRQIEECRNKDIEHEKVLTD